MPPQLMKYWHLRDHLYILDGVILVRDSGNPSLASFRDRTNICI